MCAFPHIEPVSYAETQDTLSPRGEITAIGNELRSRLTPLEARLLERVDSLDRELARSDSWRDPKVILPIVAAVWGSILVNQAIYLLTRRKDRDARHERANLYRIMKLLTVHRDELQDFERSLLGESLRAYSPSGDEGLTGIDPSRLEMWRTKFPA